MQGGDGVGPKCQATGRLLGSLGLGKDLPTCTWRDAET